MLAGGAKDHLRVGRAARCILPGGGRFAKMSGHSIAVPTGPMVSAPCGPDRWHGAMPPILAAPMNADTIRQLIESGLPGAQAQVHGPDGVHFEATVVCPEFAGKLPLARHRMVYATLGERMGGEIHALSLKTLTPAEAEAAAPPSA